MSDYPTLRALAAVPPETYRFGYELRTACSRYEVTQRRLQTMSGVDHSAISRIMNGGRIPSIETATRLAVVMVRFIDRNHRRPGCPQDPKHGSLLDWPTSTTAWYCPSARHVGTPFYTTDLNPVSRTPLGPPIPQPVLVTEIDRSTIMSATKHCNGLAGRPAHDATTDQFGVDKHTKDGFMRYCKECMSAYHKGKKAPKPDAPEVTEAQVAAVAITPEPTAESVEADLKARRAAARREQRAAKKAREQGEVASA